MKAIIMAGGKGTRLSHLMPSIPKPMVSIKGIPLLQHQVEQLVEQGMEDICLICGYRAEAIQDHFGNGEKLGAKITYINEDTPLGTGGALSMLPKETILLIMGDLYFNVNFKRFIDFHHEKKSDITLYAHPNSHPFDSDILITDLESKVRQIHFKDQPDRKDLRNLVNAGIYILSAEVLPTGPAVKRDLDKDVVFNAIREGHSVFAYRSTEYVKDMGTPKRLDDLLQDIETGVVTARNLSSRQHAVFLDRDGVINQLDGLIHLPEQIKLIDGVARAIRRLNQSHFLVICITNQPVIARGLVDLEGLNSIHGRLDGALAQEGAYLDDLFFCPHHPDKGYPEEIVQYKIECSCRKPKPGMILQAAERYNIDLKKSYMVGDTTADIMAGQAAGCKTIGVRTGEKLSDGKYHIAPDYMVQSLEEAVEHILMLC